MTFAVTLAESGDVIGSIGLEILAEHEQGRLSYWLGQAYWNRGFGTEVVTALLEYGFNSLTLHRLYAPHFHTNPASGRVLQKVGMTHEGRLREHYLRFGQRIDVGALRHVATGVYRPPIGDRRRDDATSAVTSSAARSPLSTARSCSLASAGWYARRRRACVHAAWPARLAAPDHTPAETPHTRPARMDRLP